MKSNTKAKKLHDRYVEAACANGGRGKTSHAPENPVRSQHFVQRAYLECFCGDDRSSSGNPLLWVHTSKKRWLSTPEACGKENYFYCHDPGDGSRSFMGETFLADLEAESMEVLRAAQDGRLPTKLQDRYTLTGYIALALVRTPSAKQMIDHATLTTRAELLQKTLDDPVELSRLCDELAKEGEPITPEEFRAQMMKGRVRLKQTSRAWSLRMMAEQMMFFQALFMKMNLFVVHALDHSFVTSDRPVTVANPATAPVFRDGRISHELVFPLTRSACLIGTYSRAPRKLEISAPLVKALNTIHAREADRFVYAPFEADYLQEELAVEPRRRFPEELVVAFK